MAKTRITDIKGLDQDKYVVVSRKEKAGDAGDTYRHTVVRRGTPAEVFLDQMGEFDRVGRALAAELNYIAATPRLPESALKAWLVRMADHVYPRLTDVCRSRVKHPATRNLLSAAGVDAEDLAQLTLLELDRRFVDTVRMTRLRLESPSPTADVSYYLRRTARTFPLNAATGASAELSAVLAWSLKTAVRKAIGNPMFHESLDAPLSESSESNEPVLLDLASAPHLDTPDWRAAFHFLNDLEFDVLVLKWGLSTMTEYPAPPVLTPRERESANSTEAFRAFGYAIPHATDRAVAFSLEVLRAPDEKPVTYQRVRAAFKTAVRAVLADTDATEVLQDYLRARVDAAPATVVRRASTSRSAS